MILKFFRGMSVVQMPIDKKYEKLIDEKIKIKYRFRRDL